MSPPKIYVKPALAVFKNKRILLVKDNVHDRWFMLGGNQEAGETEIEGLKREVQEEIKSEIKEDSLKFLKEFEDVAYGKDDSRVKIRLYSGELISEPSTSEEIMEVEYFDSSVDKNLLTPISIKIFDWLKQSGYIK